MSHISIIVAQAENRVIGKNNTIPWHLPRDLKHFKATTLGHPIIMGRRTYLSIGKALPKRDNHVIASCADFSPSDAFVHATLSAAIQACAHAKNIFIIGGAQLYRAAFSIADTLIVTWIHATFDGDTFFPIIDEHDWLETTRKTLPADKENPHAISFVRYERRTS